MPEATSAAEIVAAADETRKGLFELELGIEKEVDALRFRAFKERRPLSDAERAKRSELRACQAEIRNAHVDLAYVTLVRLDDADEVRSLNARIGEVNDALADDLAALKKLEDLSAKVAQVADKLAQVVGKIAERVV